MFDISVEADNQKDLERIGADIHAALKPIKGVTDSEEVDSDISDDSDGEGE
jgi:hypothetical protein